MGGAKEAWHGKTGALWGVCAVARAGRGYAHHIGEKPVHRSP